MPDYGVINDRSPHIVADLCEIIALFENTTVARGDIESFVAAKGGEGLFQELNAANDTETNERIQTLTEDAFQHLRYRQTAFGRWYPFTVQHDVIELKAEYDDYHRVYAALLSQSRLKMFERSVIAKAAAEFEAICREALPGLFPTWTIYHFGAGGLHRPQFGNKLKTALTALAEKTRDKLILDHINELSEHDVGDAGIDLVALYEWNDTAAAVPTAFCQCAAQQEGWPEKRFEASPLSLERFFSFFHKPATILFIPVCYRAPTGQWVSSDAHQSILIDRLRLTELFDLRLAGDDVEIANILSVLSQTIEPGVFLTLGSAHHAA
ncbi:MAG: hypothetical protein EOP20_05865 [Hyphomicrobiales bacterium]|nr:MAG: hypothetical protein EOP20_05865 [Hyphomicrobiales bacterium]